MLLCSSSLVLRSSLLAYACSSIILWEASISAIRHAWFNCVFSRRCSWSARAYARSCFFSFIASSQICTCSHRYSSFASWRALMVSIICCKAGASPPSDPCVPCLVLLIMSDCSVVNVGGVKSYQAPWWVPNVLTY